MLFKLVLRILTSVWRRTAGLSRWDEDAFFSTNPILVMQNGNLLIDGMTYRLWGVDWPSNGHQCQQHLITLLQWRKVYVMKAVAFGHPDKVRLVCGRGDLNKQLIIDGVAGKFVIN